ncbi:methyltransferase domain protein [Rhizoctonia solani 123E]|uniref:Methyltransferase domain protein n=1 Tax=Rhizoctonia solani 123E TaxID=1423351 RepID=A0A074SAV2_9AGAM|nr:methyltransferase domain protein [Rhizoctonia solani 123E]
MSGNLSRSMRENYDTHGIDEYYKIVGSSYRNPHFPGIKQCINVFMTKWWQHEHQPSEKGVLICDLACGSGEVTAALQEWWSVCQNQSQPAPTTSNPIVSRPPVSRPVAASPRPAVFPPTPVARPAVFRSQLAAFARIDPTEPPLRIVATDPYTSDAYRARTGLPCMAISFHDVAVDGLPDASKVLVSDQGEESIKADEESENQVETEHVSHPEDREPYDLVICSFALHLLTTPGSLYELLSTLSYGARWLVVLEPHKKPEIKDGWGWTLWDITTWQVAQGREGEFVKERVHCRVYKSTNW